jgi:formylmethanofuran dehydrogenase subunit E
MLNIKHFNERGDEKGWEELKRLKEVVPCELCGIMIYAHWHREIDPISFCAPCLWGPKKKYLVVEK